MLDLRGGSTNPLLIKRVAALSDTLAWNEFVDWCYPLIRSWCSALGLDADSVDDLTQQILMELVVRMPTYQYNPDGSFRGWLRRLCYHRAVDLFRERGKSIVQLFGDRDFEDESGRFDSDFDESKDSGKRLLLLQEAREVQESVRAKVRPIRWEVFWQVMIVGEPMNETARSRGLKYATAYAGCNHVARLLREEGRLRLESGGLDGPAASEGR